MENTIREYCLLLSAAFSSRAPELGKKLDLFLEKEGQSRLSNTEIWQASERPPEKGAARIMELKGQIPPELAGELDAILHTLGLDTRIAAHPAPEVRRSTSPASLPRKAPRKWEESNAEILRNIEQSGAPSQSAPVSQVRTFYRNTLQPAAQKAKQKIKTYRFKALHLLGLLPFIIIGGLIGLKKYRDAFPYREALVRVEQLTSWKADQRTVIIQEDIKNFRIDYIDPLSPAEQYQLMRKLTNVLIRKEPFHFALIYDPFMDPMSYPAFQVELEKYQRSYTNTNTANYQKLLDLDKKLSAGYNYFINNHKEHKDYKYIVQVKDRQEFHRLYVKYTNDYPSSLYIMELSEKEREFQLQALEENQEFKP